MEILSTPRLHLVPLTGAILRRRLESDDFEAVIDLPDGARTVTFGPQWPGEALTSFSRLLEEVGDAADAAVDLRYVAVERETGYAVAELGAKRPVDEQGAVEIGYGVNESEWGRGLGTEAVGALVDHALSRADVARVLAHTTPDNIASQRVLENTGFSRIGSTVEEGHGTVAVWERAAS
ncbi:GNAT family N-acetyltransferase [Nocardioides sp. CFH 31398]|uniref:GNAT family N-acetyltransferase n=1 Tax=Nocardioides sp. CFH 31398 TaxID=2919579 RepID=UPI001F062088|nr:GNAT family N-acetyltransferase [Nocardioides sp. CFH 31398]MCH1868136.1 GNAT family N-acetyltransferase [Nocardioides sp. CFH 31398]